MSFEDMMEDFRQSRHSAGSPGNISEMMMMHESFYNNDYDCDMSAVDKAAENKQLRSSWTDKTGAISEASSSSSSSDSSSSSSSSDGEERRKARQAARDRKEPETQDDVGILLEMMLMSKSEDDDDRGVDKGALPGQNQTRGGGNDDDDDDDGDYDESEYDDFYDDEHDQNINSPRVEMEFDLPDTDDEGDDTHVTKQKEKNRFKDVLDSSTHSYIQDKDLDKMALPELPTLPTAPPLLSPPPSRESHDQFQQQQQGYFQSPAAMMSPGIPTHIFQSPAGGQSVAGYSMASASLAPEELYNNPRAARNPLPTQQHQEQNYSGHESFDYDYYAPESAEEAQYYQQPESYEICEYAMEQGGLLHEQLQKSNWPELLETLNALYADHDAETLAQIFSVPNDRHATPMHVASWKAPKELKILMLQTIPLTDGIPQRVLNLQDVDGNTPMHLACANLELDEDGKLDATFLEQLAATCVDPHYLTNWQGDAPLHLLLASPAFRAGTSAGPAAADLLFSILRATSESANGDPHGSGIPHTANSAGATPLHVAAAAGAHEEVQLKLLQVAPGAAAAADQRGMLPLHYVAACLSSLGGGKEGMKEKDMNVNITFVSELVAAHPAAVVHACRATGDTPLHLLVSNARQHIPKDARSSRTTTLLVELLLQGESIDKGKDDTEAKKMCPLLIKNRESLYPLHCCALFNSPPSITRILMRSPFAKEAAELVDPNQATPLHLACASSVIKTSNEQVAVLGTPEAALMMDAATRTPLHIALENKHVTRELIKTLVDLNPRAAKCLNARGLMPLHLALRKRVDDAIFRGLLRTYPKAAKHVFKGDRTILHEACQYKVSIACFRALLKEYPRAARMPDKNRNIPLHIATAYEAPIEIVEALLKAYPQGARDRNRHGDVALHYAASYPATTNTARLLLDAAPETTAITNSSGETPIECATQSKIDAGTILELKEKAKEVERSMNDSASIQVEDLARDERRRSSSRRKPPPRTKSLGSVEPPGEIGTAFEFSVGASPEHSQKPTLENELLGMLGGTAQPKMPSSRRRPQQSDRSQASRQTRSSSRREPNRRPPPPSKSFDAADFYRKGSRSFTSSRSSSRSSGSPSFSHRKRRGNDAPEQPASSIGAEFDKQKRQSSSPGVPRRKRRESFDGVSERTRQDSVDSEQPPPPTSTPTDLSQRKRPTTSPFSSRRRRREDAHGTPGSAGTLRARNRMSMSSADLNYCADIGEDLWRQRDETRPRRRTRSSSLTAGRDPNRHQESTETHTRIDLVAPPAPEPPSAPDSPSEGSEVSESELLKKLSQSMLLDDMLGEALTIEDQDLMSLKTDFYLGKGKP